MTYTHLTQDERYQIYILKKAGHDQSAIAQIMERSKSTISRELKRNCVARGYRPKQAQELSIARQAKANATIIHTDIWSFADAMLAEYWSPEQSSGFLLANKQPGSVTKASINTLMLTSYLVALCTKLFAARSYVRSARQS